MNSRLRAPGGPRGRQELRSHPPNPQPAYHISAGPCNREEGHLGCEPVLCRQRPLSLGLLGPQAGVV